VTGEIVVEVAGADVDNAPVLANTYERDRSKVEIGSGLLANIAEAFLQKDTTIGIERKEWGYFRPRVLGLRDHEHDGEDRQEDPADGEDPDGAEAQRHVAARAERVLELALALRAGEQQPDGERRVADAEQHVRPCRDAEQLRRQAADAECADAGGERGPPPGEPGPLGGHRRAPCLIDLSGRHRDLGRFRRLGDSRI